MAHFEHIPESEKKKQWFCLLSPLIQRRIDRSNYFNSPLFEALNRTEGPSSWKTLKDLIEEVLTNVTNGEKIFSRNSEIANDPIPDNPIADMFAECRAAIYLLKKGFYNLVYFRQNNIDYHADFDNETYYIEATYLHGPDFKVFNDSNPSAHFIKSHEKWDYSRRVREFLKEKYLNKESQFLKRSLDPLRCLVLIFTDLMETYEPWFDHAKINDTHPIQYFVETQQIATVLHGCGSVYEPAPNSLNGTFGRLNKFSWENYGF